MDRGGVGQWLSMVVGGGGERWRLSAVVGGGGERWWWSVAANGIRWELLVVVRFRCGVGQWLFAVVTIVVVIGGGCQ